MDVFLLCGIQNLREVLNVSKYRFLNPYNFVRPLPENKSKDEDKVDIKLLGRCAPPPHDRFIGLTGKITCELTARTPLFISDSEFVKDHRSGHKSYRFFRLDNYGKEEYTIPSTSLRGMLRSVFEAVTNSCFSVFEGGLLGKREHPEKYNTGTLMAGFIIQIPAKDNEKPGIIRKMNFYKLPHSMFVRYKNRPDYNGKKVLVKIDNNSIKEIKEYTQEDHSDKYTVGYLKTSGEGLPGKKRNEYVFIDDGSAEDYELPYGTYHNYIIANKNNRFQNTKSLKIGDTIWFRALANKVTELGFSQIYRKPFKRSINDLLGQFSHPCSCYDNLCPACRLFGWAAQNPQEDATKVSYAGRIKISHAKITRCNGVLAEFPLAILSTPKPTTTFFYLLENGKPDFNVNYNSPAAQLRGRKFYRHLNVAEEQEFIRTDKKKDDQNRTVRDALKPGAKFSFDIEFENLAPVELGALLWSIEMEEDMFHKLGLAKPLGFGSVKLGVKKIKILKTRERYSSIVDDGWKTVGSEKKRNWIKTFKAAMEEKYDKNFDSLENVRDLKAILSSTELPVHYPRSSETPDPDGRNFQWFMNNKRRGKMPLELATEDTKGFPVKF